MAFIGNSYKIKKLEYKTVFKVPVELLYGI